MISDLPQLPAFLADLPGRVGAQPSIERQENGRWVLLVDKREVPAIGEHLIREHQAVLATIVGTDERPLGRGFRMYHLFNLAEHGAYVTLVSDVAAEHVGFPSIALAVPAANWAEREIADLLGLIPVGHPDARRLVLFEDWPEGLHPLRKDFAASTEVPRLQAAMELPRIEGEGVFEVPVGPVHAGIIEPGHFRFSVDGEHIINLEARLFWKHRGLEKRAEGRSAEEVLMIAERVCGACSFSHALAYSEAIETLAGSVVPERARYLRVVAAELERLYNHAGDVAGALTDVAYSVGSAHGVRLRETLLGLNEAVAGNRLLMGFNALGGVRRDLSPGLARYVVETLDAVRRDFAELMEIVQHDESVLDRFETTGILTAQVATDLGVVGPPARACGIDRDVRRDRPYAAYDRLRFPVPLERRGDVLARVRVKAAEFIASIGLIKQAIAQMPAGPIHESIGPLPAERWAFGATESARGENLHWVMTDGEGRIFRYKVRSASYMNWPALPQAVLGNIVPDFPLVNKSFNLCYSCTDR